MKSVRSRIAIAASTAVAVTSVVAIVAWTAQAQSTQTGPTATSPMDHMMMHDHSQAMQHMHGMASQSTSAPMSEKQTTRVKLFRCLVLCRSICSAICAIIWLL